MKKRTMAEILNNAIGTYYSSIGPYKTPEEACEAILDELERHGMLPPATTFEMGNMTITDNIWDKEDED